MQFAITVAAMIFKKDVIERINQSLTLAILPFMHTRTHLPCLRLSLYSNLI